MRLVLRLLARLLALALAGAGVPLALESGWALARPDSGTLVVPWQQWRGTLSPYTWADIRVLVAAGVLVGIGVLLLLLVRLGRRRDVRLVDPADGVRVVTSPRAVARLVGHHVREQDGVGSAVVTATRRRVRVRATSALAPEGALRPALRRTVGDLVADLPLVRTPRVRVSVQSSRERR